MMRFRRVAAVRFVDPAYFQPPAVVAPQCGYYPYPAC